MAVIANVFSNLWPTATNSDACQLIHFVIISVRACVCVSSEHLDVNVYDYQYSLQGLIPAVNSYFNPFLLLIFFVSHVLAFLSCEP